MQRRIVPDILQDGADLLQRPATANVFDAVCAMCDRGVGRLLVTEGGRLAGIFTERDLLNRVVAADREPRATPLADVMTANLTTISPKATALEALRLMEDTGYRHLPVVADGRALGILSRRDLTGAEKARLYSESDLWERL